MARIFGAPSDDILVGTDQNDSIFGQGGHDLLRGKAGDDVLDGAEGNDALLGSANSDTLNGGSGDDVLQGDGELRLLGLTDRNAIVTFDPSQPSLAQTATISGIDGTLISIDVRPADGLLYGLTDTNKLYIINPTTGGTTFISTLSPISFTAAQQSGVDFNPVPDRLRLVGSNEQNLRVNVDNGAVADFDPNTPGVQPDQTLAYAPGDRNFGQNPNITGAAYTNSFAPSPDSNRRTTLYEIDSNLDVLVRQGGLNFPDNPPSPNTGQLFTVGGLGVDFAPTAGFDIYSPAGGINVAYAVSGAALFRVDLNTGVATRLGSVGNGLVNFVGLAASTEQVGNGNDRLNGGDGNDTLRGGAGNDRLNGENGNDSLSGDLGDDQLNGGDGNDVISAGDGNDVLKGENGTDSLDGGAGNDSLDGGDGNDTLVAGMGSDLIKSANGDDLVDGGDGVDLIDGGDGNDLLRGGAGNDAIEAQTGNDALLGGAGDDTLNGSAGDDTIEGDGELRLLGLTDRNAIVTFDPSQPSLAQTATISGIDGTLISIDVRPADGLLYGLTDTNKLYIINPTTGGTTFISTLSPISFTAAQQSGVDFNPVPDRLRLVGSNEQNLRVNVDNGAVADFDPNTPGVQPDQTLAYAPGDRNFGQNPNITGAAYTNSFAPSPDSNRRTTLYEIDSNLDVLVRQGGLNFPDNPPSPNTGQLFTVGGLGVDFAPTAGFDIYSPAGGINVAYAVSGAALFRVDLNTGVATRLGSVGNGLVNFVGLAASTEQVGNGNDRLNGGDGNDTLRGGAGNDRLNGENGNDSLNGQVGQDFLTGGNDNDTLVGGAGDDTLKGGAGSDLFTFNSNVRFNVADFGIDRIQDFEIQVDKIVLDKTSFTALQSVAGNGFSTASEFAIVSSDQDAANSSAAIVYSRNSGNLFYNPDGAIAGFNTGGQFVRLDDSPRLSAANFQIVA
jgi:Ca2+-binding RTX toxin-like protein